MITLPLLDFFLVVLLVLPDRDHLCSAALASHFVWCAGANGPGRAARPLHDVMHCIDNVVPVKTIADLYIGQSFRDNKCALAAKCVFNCRDHVWTKMLAAR